MAKAKATNRTSGDDKNLLLYVAAFGALLLIVVYVLVYQRLVTEADAIEASNRTLSQRVSELKVYYDNRAKYLEDTQVMEQLTDELLTVYPADAREEDAIMLAVQMQRSGGAEFLSINMQAGNVIHEVSAETVAAAASEKYTQALQFCNMDAIYVNEVSYTGLKEMIQTIQSSSNRIGIQNIVYSKGDAENPNLSGHIDLVFYSVDGTGKEYTPPDIAPYIAGTDNIFGDIAIPKEPAASRGEEDDNGDIAEGEEDAQTGE